MPGIEIEKSDDTFWVPIAHQTCSHIIMLMCYLSHLYHDNSWSGSLTLNAIIIACCSTQGMCSSYYNNYDTAFG